MIIISTHYYKQYCTNERTEQHTHHLGDAAYFPHSRALFELRKNTFSFVSTEVLLFSQPKNGPHVSRGELADAATTTDDPPTITIAEQRGFTKTSPSLH